MIITFVRNGSLQALAARLEALENDGTVQDTFAAAASDDEEFLIDVDSEGGTMTATIH